MIGKKPITEYEKQENDLLIDLRDRTVFAFGTLPEAENIPMYEIGKLYSLPRDKRIVLFCQQGDLSEEIAELLDDNGYQVLDLTGGYREWIVRRFI